MKEQFFDFILEPMFRNPGETHKRKIIGWQAFDKDGRRIYRGASKQEMKTWLRARAIKDTNVKC